MNFKKINECERNRLERWAQFQLPHKWKLGGIIICVILILMLLGLKLTRTDSLWSDFALQRALLISLLIVSLSKDKIEDEMIVSLRAKSFTLAFILAVLYALIQPVINAFFFYIFKGYVITDNFSYFQILSFMLLLQILFFEVLKRYR
ncbi:hypothetical protein [Winogradskyella sp.]|uniref:hypothetical protein n=1 Tax=Winogradskyella sp. TaxID=1883156 RepID=UPI0026090CBA|nr:hypothetical protein [Winogradskyella sp.]